MMKRITGLCSPEVGRKTWRSGLLRLLCLVSIVAVMVGCTTVSTPTLESSPMPTANPSLMPMAVPPSSPVHTTPPSPSPGQNSSAGSGQAPTDPRPSGQSPVFTPAPPETPSRFPTPNHGLTLTPISPLTPVASPTPKAAPDTGEIFRSAPDRDLYDLARKLLLKTAEPIPRVVNPDPVSYTEGRRDTFWLTDIQNVRAYTNGATLRVVSPHAYWYVEDGMDISQKDLERASRIFEEEIYPRVTTAFGTEWTPGVDNDPHLTILHARLRGVGGYFSSVDEYPASVHQHSNQREMLYINTSGLDIDSGQYLATLSHELQHAIHWNGDSTEETWVNEGLAEVASIVAGYRPASQDIFIHSPTVSLVNWPLGQPSGVHYGAAFLFFDYLADHYGTYDDLAALVKEPLDGIPGINAYLARLGYDVTFRDVFKNWTVANFLDEPGDGPYSYPDKDVGVSATARMSQLGERESSVPQYSAKYIELDINKGDVKIGFQGQKENLLLSVSLDGGRCWWSNRGDSISSTLTRTLDLSNVDRATLRFRIWYAVEKDWDYGYVEVSTDGGTTWDIIPAPGTSPRNPVGNSFGPGYTGSSNDWFQEEVDLTPYAGRQALLRFHYVTDEAINGIGLCFDDISVPEIGFFDDDQEDGGWRAEGFIRVDNRVPQDYVVQVIEVGDQTRVREMDLDEDNRGEMVVRGLEDLDDLVVVVAALAPETLQPANYTLRLEPAS